MATRATPVLRWADACATNIINNNVTTGLVDQFGQPMSSFNIYTWGVDHPTCYAYCGKDKIYQEFNFNIFANAFTSWLLPWVTLTAQLPYEASNPQGNLMSLYMAVGSPALITYSLTITILNRNWVRVRFEKLRKQLSNFRDINLQRELTERLQSAQYLLQESQQVPMRASQTGGWLSSLIALEDNGIWWKRVRKDLQNSRRGYTFSLVAQIGMALIAYTFTVAITMTSSPLGTSEGVNIELTAGGGLWVWMIPVIWGWIMCGTQDRSNSITEALNDETCPASRVDENGKIEDRDPQRGISSRSGLIPTSPKPRDSGLADDNSKNVRSSEIQTEGEDHSATPAAHNTTETSRVKIRTVTPSEASMESISKDEYTTINIPTWLGYSIEGDEALEGPIFNYARLFTFREFSSTITKAFDAHILSLISDKSQSRSMLEVAKSCDLDERRLKAYTSWRDTDATTWHDILIAAAAAIFVQWGTTSPAIMMAYLTPTIGLGCRSGSYLIYGVAATVSWALLISSSFFSHAANLKYQEIYNGDFHVQQKDPEEAIAMQELLQHSNNPPILNLTKHRRTRWHTTLITLTITTRILGKCIAAANACWIVVSAIFEYTGVYSQCWCDSNADVLGNRGWVVLFASNESFRQVAKASWVGGVIFSFGVCFVAWVGFVLGCRRTG